MSQLQGKKDRELQFHNRFITLWIQTFWDTFQSDFKNPEMMQEKKLTSNKIINRKLMLSKSSSGIKDNRFFNGVDRMLKQKGQIWI